MSWFTDLFGSTEAAVKVVSTAADGIYNGVDKAWYTTEEASDAFFKIVDRAYDDNSFRSVTRRWLAWSITAWVLINAQIGIVLKLSGYPSYLDSLLDTADKLLIGWAFASAVGFFFVVQIPRAWKKRERV